MAAPDLRGFIQVGFDILKTTVDAVTKKILVQIGDVHASEVDANSAELWQHIGFASRAPKPEAKRRAGQAAVIRCGDHDIVFATQDLRGLELYGSLADGETCIYAAGEDGEAQARVLLKKDGSINLYTRKGNTSTGAGMVIQLDAENGAIRLINDKGYGLIVDGDGVKLTAGSSALTLGGSGDVTLLGTGTTKVDGGGVMVGASALPTGVATQASTAPLLIAVQAMLTTMQTFFNATTVQAISAGTAVPVAAACAAVQVAAALPTNFSQKTTSG